MLENTEHMEVKSWQAAISPQWLGHTYGHYSCFVSGYPGLAKRKPKKDEFVVSQRQQALMGFIEYVRSKLCQDLNWPERAEGIQRALHSGFFEDEDVSVVAKNEAILAPRSVEITDAAFDVSNAEERDKLITEAEALIRERLRFIREKLGIED